MNIEKGDMLVCARDYGIVMKVEEGRATVHWFDRYSGDNCRNTYWAETLESSIDGENNQLIKGN
jgi:hypothetical protein